MTRIVIGTWREGAQPFSPSGIELGNMNVGIERGRGVGGVEWW